MMTEYNKLVDHLVSTMPSNSSPMTNNERPPFVPKNVSTTGTYYNEFDTPAYNNYKALIDKEREQINSDNLTEYIYKLGFKIDTLLTKIISQLDTVLEEDKKH